MGEAKRRGTREERVDAAIFRAAVERKRLEMAARGDERVMTQEELAVHKAKQRALVAYLAGE